MEIIFNFGNDVDKMQPGRRTTFDDLDFITDRFGDLQLQEPEPPMEKEQPPPVCALFAKLEEAVGAGPCALARHLNHYGRDVFTKIG
jgi:hypothetical protein